MAWHERKAIWLFLNMDDSNINRRVLFLKLSYFSISKYERYKSIAELAGNQGHRKERHGGKDKKKRVSPSDSEGWP